MWAWLRRSEAGEVGLSTLAFASGVVFVTMMFASGAAMTSVAASVEFGSTPVPDGEFARQLEQLGFVFLLLYGMLAVGVCVAATSVSALGTGVLPRWLAIAGLAVALVVGALGVFFLPMILLVLWVLAVSIAMLAPTTTPALVA